MKSSSHCSKRSDREVRERVTGSEVDTRELRAEITRVSGEQRNLAKVVAMASDIPELLTEMNQRSAQLRHLPRAWPAASRSPEEKPERLADIEARAWQMVGRRTETLADDRDALRELFLTLFPKGLIFTPTKPGRRSIWKLDGVAHLGNMYPKKQKRLPRQTFPICVVTPQGIEPWISA